MLIKASLFFVLTHLKKGGKGKKAQKYHKIQLIFNAWMCRCILYARVLSMYICVHPDSFVIGGPKSDNCFYLFLVESKYH